MTPNRRIFLNIVATYGRSLYALVIGLFCGRWTLMALGEVDYGLMGAVGCLIGFIGFFNSVLVGGATRFYAISIGQAQVAKDKVAALEESRRWFNTALTIETAFPIVLLAIGYPIGEWAVRHFMTIPPDRIGTCVWVFRCSCVSAFIGMVCCPFNAMYGAKQYIAELTVYSFITTTLTVCFAGYMVSHPRDNWLLIYALFSCFVAVAPNLIIAFRARFLFPECRIVPRYMWDRSRLKVTLGYTGCIVMGAGVSLLRNQGITVLINKLYGPRVNAAMAIGHTVNGHASSLSGSLMGAFSPAIMTAYGTGDYRSANKLALRGCKFAMVLSLLFTLPLALELPEVMTLWLKNPPRYATGLCLLMIINYLADVCTTGHRIAVNAHGKIFWYNLILSSISVLTLPIALVAGLMGGNVYCVGWTLVIMGTINSIGRVCFARHYVGMSVRYWMFRVIWPVIIMIGVCGGIGYLPHLAMPASFLRVCITAVITEGVFIPLVWFVTFDDEEREYMKTKLLSKVVKRWAKG